MSIAWAYLDKKAASADALKDYSIMEFIIKSHRDSMAEKRSELTSLGSSVPDGLPKARNPHGGEARLAAMIDAIDVLTERYRQALEFMEWFQPAWDELSVDDKFVLNEFYRNDDDEQQGNPVDSVSEYFHIERTSAYKKKNRALERLTALLYGKC